MAPVDIDRLSVLSTAMAQIPGDGVLSSIDRVCIAAVDRLSLMANGELLGTAGIRSVFALPLALGAIRIGVLALYRDVSGSAPRVARTARAAYSS